MDIKAWLETAGEPVAETCFTDPVPLPFSVFHDTVQRQGGDMQNLMSRHIITVEHYSLTKEGEAELETLLDAQAIKYQKEREWLDDERCFMTIYTFELIEREILL